MVTSKRNEYIESERMVGFDAELATGTEEEAARVFSDDISRMRSYCMPSRNAIVIAPPDAAAPAPAIERERVIEPQSERKAERSHYQPRPRSVYMPDIQVREKVREGNEEIVDRREQLLSSTAKKLLAVYLTLIIAVVIAVVATGIAISGLEEKTDELQGNVSQLEMVIGGQEARLDQLADPSYIENEAEDLGMVKIDPNEVVSYPQLDSSKESSEKNTFDAIRDWLKGSLGD